MPDDLINRAPGYNPHRFVELLGGDMVPMSNYEPDPQTFRGDYYYNTRYNKLYKKLTRGVATQQTYWKVISESS